MGTIEPRASGEIEVKPGEERSGIEFRLPTHVGGIIAGRIERAAGPEATVSLLTPKRQELRPSRSGTVSADGAFTISRVPPGTYFLQARTGGYPPKQGDLFGERQIHVGDLRNFVLEMRAVEPMQLSGTVTLEDGSTRPLTVATLADALLSTWHIQACRTGKLCANSTPAGINDVTWLLPPPGGGRSERRKLT